MVKVFIKFDSAIIKEVELTKNVITFGRKEDNDIILDNPAISGHHGKIFKEGDRYILEDLKSTNGTFVNGLSLASCSDSQATASKPSDSR